MQEKPKNKLQLEDYFQAVANRRSMFSTNEVEQLISSDKKPVKSGISKTKTNLLKILTIMTLFTATIAALIFMINPVHEEIAKQKTEKIASEKEVKVTENNLKRIKENPISESKKIDFKLRSKPVNNYDNKEKQPQKQVAVSENKHSLNRNTRIVEKEESKSGINEPIQANSSVIDEQQKPLTTNNKDDKQIKLEGIHLIELSREELLQIGFKVKGDSVLYSSNGYAFNFGFSKGGTVIDLNQMRSDANVKKSKKGKVFPDLVTDDLGNWRTHKSKEKGKQTKEVSFTIPQNQPLTITGINKAEIDTTQIKQSKIKKKVANIQEIIWTSRQEVLEKINTMVPILVKTCVGYTIEDSLNQRYRPDLILWYEVTNDFLKTLPKDLRKKIENEYYQLTKQPEKLENAASPSNCEYFEVCRSTLKSASEVIVFPNPAIEYATMRFNLKEEASLKVNLYDISGRLVRELKSFSNLSKGQHQLTLDLNGVSEGMYLIVLESEKGETNIQRLVKGKK